MRRLALDPNGERTDAFARGLQRTSRTRRLANQRGGTLTRQILGDRARAVTAPFFVGNQQHFDRSRQGTSNLVQRGQREHHLRNAALHVENARPIKPPILLAPRHGRKRSYVINRIEVT